ncbi:substrate-binding domain-containing protein [Microbispora sp. H11081]|uniref:substrate-binding domain-containing protein n=1 Tax=Microbispora sp. H11081 TaxID=2729107 RepID=UPI0014739CE8|nr:substrate-binding domain-containing protein [Microbispora sp. H11081]
MGRRLAGVWVLLLMSLPACGPGGQERGAELGAVGDARDGFTVGLLLPGDGPDRLLFTRSLASLCPSCDVRYANAAGDQARQGRQVGQMLADGVRVLVLGPVDPGAAAPLVARAKLAGAKVVAYDRLANGPVDAYVATDPARVGRAQALALLDAMKVAGPVLLVNGPAADPYAAAVKRGLHAVLDGRVTIGWERDLTRPGDVRGEVAAAVAALGGAAAKVAGVCSTSEGTAEYVAAEMAKAGLAGVPLIGYEARPGRAGPRTVTVRTDVAAQAAAAARLAVEVAGGRTVYGTAVVSNGTTVSIPAVLVPPAVVTRPEAAGPPAPTPPGTAPRQGVRPH